MTNQKIIIVEDEFVIALDIQTSLIAKGYDIPAIAENFDQAVAYTKEFLPDVILMDIYISGDKNGIETANHIYEEFNIPIIFLTANSDDKTFKSALKSKPFGYILKPFKIEELVYSIEVAIKKNEENQKINLKIDEMKSIVDEKTDIEKENTALSEINKTLQISNQEVGGTLFIKEKSKFTRLNISDILWIEAMDNYSIIVTKNKKSIVSLFLKQLNKKLPESKFIRIHRSYIVAIDKIDGIEENTLYVNKKILPIGKSFREELISKLNVF